MAERNSLRVQSGEHKDGWGIAYYDGRGPEVARGLGPAHSDPDFERVSGILSAQTVLAHVRLASVGAVSLPNAHPFLWQRWSFAHNGTIRDFRKHQVEIEALIDPALRGRLTGETDSERCFYLFLTQLGAVASAELSVETIARALAQTIRKLSAIADGPGLEPSSMNFLVTDGARMLATRRKRSLYFSEAKEKRACDHVEPATGARLQQLVIASEKLCSEKHWHEVAEDSVIGVDDGLRFHHYRLAEL